MEFEPTSYMVTEGMVANIMIVLHGQSNIPVIVEFNTQDISATGMLTMHNFFMLLSMNFILL